jgi:hypothetical protein
MFHILERRKCVQGFDWKKLRKGSLGRLRHTRDNNIKLGVNEI